MLASENCYNFCSFLSRNLKFPVSEHFLYFSVLLFPPVNSYRRFLIHKVCETVTANQPRALTTFSIGVGEQRRTVICHRYQLLVDLKSVSLKRFVFNQVLPIITFFTTQSIFCSVISSFLIFIIVCRLRFNACGNKAYSLCPFRFRSEEAEFTWNYLNRNAVPKASNHRFQPDMGVEKIYEDKCK